MQKRKISGAAAKRNSDSQGANFTPSKNFFVRMLVRDIELEDAILDLLDNCIDGVVRTNKRKAPKNSSKPYTGFHAHLTLKPDRFEIVDNCGGISKKTARNSAFRLGRLPGEAPDLPTVGMYGIGMKRAIFKMAESARIESLHHESNFRVNITSEWLKSDQEWHLPLRPMKHGALKTCGTSIVVDKLIPEIAQKFSEQSNFIDDFIGWVASHYALIIEKGFEVKINGTAVLPKPFELLTGESQKVFVDRTGLAPYYFKGRVDEVDIEMFAGLYRKIPDEAELEAETSSRGSTDDAGWSVSCNDRIVVYRDKSRLTGWGDSGVPNYHGQFIAITGLVLLNSDKPEKLPLTTTKRGLEASTNIYLVVREQMQLATKYFTQFTNKWKKKENELEEIYKKSKPQSVVQLRALLSSIQMSQPKKIPGSVRFEPSLPTPEKMAKDVRIAFSRPKGVVDELGKKIFGNHEWKPSELGEDCFERAYARLVKGNR